MTESKLNFSEAAHDEIVPAGEHWLHLITKGQTLRIEDMEGNQAADTLLGTSKNPPPP